MGNIAYSQSGENELKEITLEGEEYVNDAWSESQITALNNRRQIDMYYFQKAKFKLISGDFKMATYFLNRIDDKKSLLTSIKNRYLAIIYFLENHFAKSLAALDTPEIVSSTKNYTETCLLKIINLIALNDLHRLNREKIECLPHLTSFSKNDQFWLDSMIKLKIHDEMGLRSNLVTNLENVISDEEMSKLWLKTGLYLNKEKELLELISILPESFYQSKKLREIIAFMYLRSGNAKKAMTFVDDIDSANAENIKGNINLANKEYELAFGHFRLALQKKQDSNNSIERAIPLAWIIGQWEDGLMMLENLSTTHLDPRKIAAVKIAFLIRNKQFELAQKELIFLKKEFQNEPPTEVSIMDTYVNLILGKQSKDYDRRKVEESAEKSCRAHDGISCWIAMQYISWDNLGKTIARDDAIMDNSAALIEALKEKKVITPLQEEKTIDQADIEELDSRAIHFVP